MKIADSAIQFSSSHTAVQHNETRETLMVWNEKGAKENPAADRAKGKNMQAVIMGLEKNAVNVSLSTEARKSLPVKAQAEGLAKEDRVLASLNMRILKAFFERITGKKIKLADPDQIRQDIEHASQQHVNPGHVQEGNPEGAEGWGLVYDYYESHYEYESSAFSAQGVIQTEDGREIDFSVTLNMSREFMSEQQVSLRAGDALKDPLVVNFDGNAAALTQTTFAFDIDADGRDDQIAFVEPGSGFLVLDKNNDRKINDGSELFGALTGDGFAELTAYDEDKNGWIDENDSVYDRLRIWTGVGAMYLGHVSTPFAIKDADNALQGQVNATGVFLYDDGRAGTLQQLDLVA